MNLKEKIDNLPKTPGIYMMKDKYGDVIYVGKSKKLKERVKSYFVNSKNHSRKVKRMVKNIEDLDVILTDTELDALILECEMIKKIRPMYNQLLKNHENYSYIKINKNIKYPYIEVSKEIEDYSLYFGPYTMDKKLDEIVSIISREYKTRTCKIMNKCIKYDLNKCIGPCREIVSKEDYVELHAAYGKRLRNAEESIRAIQKEMDNELEKADKANTWLDYFVKYQDIEELSRTVVVELIRQIRVYDKKNIEITFDFDDCYQTLLNQLPAMGVDMVIDDDNNLQVNVKEVV